MNLSHTTFSEQADKRFIYRYYSWNQIIFLLVINGLVSLVLTWLAITSRQVGLWFCALVSFTAFLFYGWIAILDTRNKFVITVSQTGIQLPIIWKRGTTVHLPFSSINTVELIKLRRETLLKISAGKEIRVISEACFPQRQDFKELIDIVQQCSPIPFSFNS